jgi:anti-anti-sigma factor
MTTPHTLADRPTLGTDRATYFVGRDTLVVRVGPGSGTEQFATTVETFGEATQVACRTLVLDLSGVDRINSDLLGLLLWAHGRLRMRGAELVVARPSRATREVLARSGLDFVLTMSNDLPVAAA